MSIKEALGSPGEYRGQIIDDNQLEEYRNRVHEKARELLRRSGVTEILEELRGHIFLSHTDVHYPSERRHEALQPGEPSMGIHYPDPDERFERFGGNITIELGWKYRKERPSWNPNKLEVVHDSIEVLAQPITGDLVIQGKINELIPQSVWGDGAIGRRVLEQAIARAYLNPGHRGEPTLIV